MNTDPIYDWGTLALSVALVVIFARIAWLTAGSYRRNRDDRAAWSLLIAVLKLVVAVGLLVSASGLVLGHFGVDQEDAESLAVAGLAVVRGSMLVAGLALLMGGKHWR